ncbi:hypothetical protein HK102_000268 [Quaeritorhiza haematococci]|nr:hypothetical protein HK102_000268 [Quaeritorhiza haematococci]
MPPRDTSESLAAQLVYWADDFGYRERQLPLSAAAPPPLSSDELEKLCKGHLVPIWGFLVTRVKPKREVQAIRRALRKYLQETPQDRNKPKCEALRQRYGAMDAKKNECTSVKIELRTEIVQAKDTALPTKESTRRLVMERLLESQSEYDRAKRSVLEKQRQQLLLEAYEMDVKEQTAIYKEYQVLVHDQVAEMKIPETNSSPETPISSADEPETGGVQDMCDAITLHQKLLYEREDESDRTPYNMDDMFQVRAVRPGARYINKKMASQLAPSKSLLASLNRHLNNKTEELHRHSFSGEAGRRESRTRKRSSALDQGLNMETRTLMQKHLQRVSKLHIDRFVETEDLANRANESEMSVQKALEKLRSTAIESKAELRAVQMANSVLSEHVSQLETVLTEIEGSWASLEAVHEEIRDMDHQIEVTRDLIFQLQACNKQMIDSVAELQGKHRAYVNNNILPYVQDLSKHAASIVGMSDDECAVFGSAAVPQHKNRTRRYQLQEGEDVATAATSVGFPLYKSLESFTAHLIRLKEEVRSLQMIEAYADANRVCTASHYLLADHQQKRIANDVGDTAGALLDLARSIECVVETQNEIYEYQQVPELQQRVFEAKESLEIYEDIKRIHEEGDALANDPSLDPRHPANPLSQFLSS